MVGVRRTCKSSFIEEIHQKLVSNKTKVSIMTTNYLYALQEHITLFGTFGIIMCHDFFSYCEGKIYNNSSLGYLKHPSTHSTS